MADSAVATPRSALQPAGKPRALAQRVALAMEGLGRIGDDLAKYEYLVGLLDRDPRLFFATLEAHTSTIVPLVYTPVVGAACQQWSHLLAPAKGLYISLDDAGRVAELLRQWPAASVRAICVTDGGRILGLGDLGANGMGIPVGKLALYSGLAGVDPAVTLPVTLDVGTDNEELLADPVYCGLRRRREGGPAYYALVKEFVAAVLSVFGPDTLVQWEDFNNASAFKILDDYKQVVPSFNDDIEGTASVRGLGGAGGGGCPPLRCTPAVAPTPDPDTPLRSLPACLCVRARVLAGGGCGPAVGCQAHGGRAVARGRQVPVLRRRCVAATAPLPRRAALRGGGWRLGSLARDVAHDRASRHASPPPPPPP